MRKLATFFIDLVVAVLLLAVVALAVLYTGAYNTAADAGEPGVLRWVFETAQERSIAAEAPEEEAPLPSDSTTLRRGYGLYAAQCAVCHGAPGVPVPAIGRGLHPPAEPLVEAVKERSPGALYWIIRHGLRRTGMPAFGPSHSEEELRAVVAFVRRLPEMSPAAYAAFSAPAADTSAVPPAGPAPAPADTVAVTR